MGRLGENKRARAGAGSETSSSARSDVVSDNLYVIWLSISLFSPVQYAEVLFPSFLFLLPCSSVIFHGYPIFNTELVAKAPVAFKSIETY